MAFKRKSRDDGTAGQDSGRAGGVATVDAPKATATADHDRTEVGDSATSASTNERGVRLGEQLIGSNLITDAQLQQALDMQRDSGGRLGEVLVSIGALSDQALAHALAAFFGFEVANLRRENIDPAVTSLLSEDVAREYSSFPVRLTNEALFIAVAEPSDDLQRILSEKSGHAVRLLIAPLSDVQWAIDSNYRAIGSVEKLVHLFESVEGTRRKTIDSATQELVADDAPVVQVVDRILTQAMRDRASDVHIEPSDEIVRVRFRIDGALKEILQLPAAIGPGLVSRIKIMANMNIVERRRPQDGQLTIDIDGKDVDVRVATVSTIMGESCVMRLLDKTRSVLRLNDLGMPVDTHAAYSKIVRAPFGMVLCAGPTGSGKTTTLYATLSEVNNPTLNVMTIEDPVEYVFPTINQIQTNDQAGLTFATGLKSILRQDPDVILVGEIRDVETTRVAVQSALTGHFVVSSLHATDSVSALAPIPRHGDRVIPHRLLGARRRRPATPATDLPFVQDRLHADRRGAGLLRGERRIAEGVLLPRRRMQLLQQHRVQGPDRRLRASRDDARVASARRGLGDTGRIAQHGGEAGDEDPAPGGHQSRGTGRDVYRRGD